MSDHPPEPALGRPQPEQSSVQQQIDRLFLSQTIELAQRGVFSVTANPRVGCLIVRDGRVIGRGAHLRAGDAHAEVRALQDARDDVRGATLYVSLEPCAIVGRTPACAQTLVAAGIGRVVCAATDPHPDVSGQGIAILRAAGVEVQLIELPDARWLNYGHARLMGRGWPYVRLKIAQSLDGRTAMANGESKWITSAQARRDVQYWRARSGAIVTGVGTVLLDDPALSVRDPVFEVQVRPGQKVLRQPLRVVLDSNLRTPTTAQICADGGPTLLVHGQPAARAGLPVAVQQGYPSQVEIASYPDLSADVSAVAPADTGRVHLESVLRELGRRGCTEVLVEAGAGLVGSFLEAQLWDELLIYVAPKFLGSQARAMANIQLNHMDQAIEAKIVSTDMVGGDIRTRLIPPWADLAEIDVEPVGYPNELRRAK